MPTSRTIPCGRPRPKSRRRSPAPERWKQRRPPRETKMIIAAIAELLGVPADRLEECRAMIVRDVENAKWRIARGRGEQPGAIKKDIGPIRAAAAKLQKLTRKPTLGKVKEDGYGLGRPLFGHALFPDFLDHHVNFRTDRNYEALQACLSAVIEGICRGRRSWAQLRDDEHRVAPLVDAAAALKCGDAGARSVRHNAGVYRRRSVNSNIFPRGDACRNGSRHSLEHRELQAGDRLISARASDDGAERAVDAWRRDRAQLEHWPHRNSDADEPRDFSALSHQTVDQSALSSDNQPV
jgi:hypothetical protein